MSAETIDHPLLDGRGPGWAATETRAEVVALTVGMSDFLHRVATAGERPLVVSGEFSRMTQPLAEVLSAVSGHWVIRTTDDGCYDARTGARLDRPEDVLTLPPRPTAAGVHPAFTRAAIATRLQLVATVSTRHRVNRPVRLGGVLEAASEQFADAAPTAWGPTEPLVAAWDRDDLSERSRRRMPLDSRWAAVTAGDRPLVGTMRVTRTSEGLEETSRIWAGVAPANDARGEGIALEARDIPRSDGGDRDAAPRRRVRRDRLARSGATIDRLPAARAAGAPHRAPGRARLGPGPPRLGGRLRRGRRREPAPAGRARRPRLGGGRWLAAALRRSRHPGPHPSRGACLSRAACRRAAPPRRKRGLMADHRDTVLIEQARLQRMRLGSALLYGRIDERRTVNDHMRRLMGSLIVAAVVCAVCVGVSFVVQLLSDQAQAAPAVVSSVAAGSPEVP